MSPARRRASRAVEAPTWEKTEVTEPAAASQSAMVSGMRSPSSAARRITNMPGSAASATSGACTVSTWRLGAIMRRSTMPTMVLPSGSRRAVCGRHAHAQRPCRQAREGLEAIAGGQPAPRGHAHRVDRPSRAGRIGPGRGHHEVAAEVDAPRGRPVRRRACRGRRGACARRARGRVRRGPRRRRSGPCRDGGTPRVRGRA